MCIYIYIYIYIYTHTHTHGHPVKLGIRPFPNSRTSPRSSFPWKDFPGDAVHPALLQTPAANPPAVNHGEPLCLTLLV